MLHKTLWRDQCRMKRVHMVLQDADPQFAGAQLLGVGIMRSITETCKI